MTRSLEGPEVHGADQQCARHGRERGEEEADGEGGEQRLERRLVEDGCERPRQRDAEVGELEAQRKRRPEDRRPVHLGQVGAWMSAAPEPEIGEERYEDHERDDDARDPELGRGRADARG